MKCVKDNQTYTSHTYQPVESLQTWVCYVLTFLQDNLSRRLDLRIWVSQFGLPKFVVNNFL